jgi:membrane protein DedA with SNARE-associated domain
VGLFRTLLLRHGYSFLFGYIFAVQVGIPVPADPLLLIMGAMAGDHRYSLHVSLSLAVIAALLGDYFWYELGRWRGRSILGALCKISLEPDTCVRKTEMGFTRRGAWTLLFAKFIPGMSLVSMPLAGAICMERWRFLLADAAGCTLWATAYLIAGYTFHRQVDSLIGRLGLFGQRAGLVALVLVAAYIGLKYFQRWRFRRQTRLNRIMPHAALELLNSGRPVTVVDLRNRIEIEQDGLKIRGAVVVRSEDLELRSHEIPDDREVILYCT